MIGIRASVHALPFDVANCILAGHNWWAVERVYGARTNLHDNVEIANNLANPSFAPSAGPFMEHLNGGNGFWFTCTPSPGPTLSADPRLANPALGDYRLQGDSPRIDSGDSPLKRSIVTTD